MKNPLRTLSRLLPKGTLRFDSATLQANSSDAWVASALPTAVAFPRTTEQVSKILAFTYRHRIPVTTRGAGRGYVGGCVPVRGGLVISLVKMNRILQISPADGVALPESIPFAVEGPRRCADEESVSGATCLEREPVGTGVCEITVADTIPYLRVE